MSEDERSEEQEPPAAAPNVEPVSAAQIAREGFDDEVPDDETRVVPRRRGSGNALLDADAFDHDDATRIVSRRRGGGGAVAFDEVEVDDSTRLSSRVRGSLEQADEADLDDDSADQTRLASRVRDRGAADGVDEDATRLSQSRDRSPTAPGAADIAGSPLSLPPDIEATEIARGSFGTAEGAYVPRSASAAQQVPRLSDPSQSPRDGGAQGQGVLSPAEAARRKDAARRRRLLFTMSAAAVIAAVGTLAVLAIVFMLGGGES